MAETSLVYRNGPTKIDEIELDCAISESHVGEVDITEHPVEEGFNVSDHSRPKPDALTLEGIVSNTPFNQSQRTRVIKVLGDTKFQSNSQADRSQGTPGYAEAAYTKLRKLRDTGKIISVVTQIRTYSNMVMTSLAIPRDGKTGDALRFTASFKQIRVVKNKATKKVVSKEPKAQPKAKAGKQTANTANDSQKKKSILKQFDDGVLGGGLRKLLTPGGA
jgi:hypothetical protein